MSSILAFSRWNCTVAVLNLHPITSPTTSSAHCASPAGLGPLKQPLGTSYGRSRRSTRSSDSGALKFEKGGKFDSFFSSGSSPICRSHGVGPLRSVDGPSCSDSVQTFIVTCSVQQEVRRRELVGAISSWIVLPELINAGSSAFGVASAAEDDEPSQESSITTEAPAKTGLIEKLLERSKANKARYDQERLDSYYRRNYRDYFEFLGGGLQDKDKSTLTEAEKGILSWLEKNR